MERDCFPSSTPSTRTLWFSHLTCLKLLAYIIYDTIGKVLSMIPCEPSCCEVSRTTRLLIARRHPGYNDQSYALVLMAKMPKFAGEDDAKFAGGDDAKGKGKMPEFAEEDVLTGDEEDVLTGEDVFLGKAKKVEFAGGEDDGDNDINWQDVLLLWPSSSSSPWELTKTANLPNQWLDDESSFVADLTFSFEGHGFWADLLCGVLFCSCDDLLCLVEGICRYSVAAFAKRESRGGDGLRERYDKRAHRFFFLFSLLIGLPH